jgi:hypothetical protein
MVISCWSLAIAGWPVRKGGRVVHPGMHMHHGGRRIAVESQRRSREPPINESLDLLVMLVQTLSLIEGRRDRLRRRSVINILGPPPTNSVPIRPHLHRFTIP